MQERWAFSIDELENPSQCHGNDELVAYIDIDDEVGDGVISFGIIVLRNGKVTNRFDDGAIGMPDEFIKFARHYETLLHHDGYETHEWRNVEIDNSGNFTGFV